MEFSKEEWIRHAKLELEIVDEGQELTEYYLKVIEAFCDYNHDEKSLYFTPTTLEKLMRHENLSWVTSNPNEWRDLGNGLWRNKRNPNYYSNDMGKTKVEFPRLDTNTNSNLNHEGMPESVNEKIDKLKDL
jgi:hypothetical protein